MSKHICSLFKGHIKPLLRAKRGCIRPYRDIRRGPSRSSNFVAETRQFSRAESTQRKYVNEFHQFEMWYDKARLSALPASPETVERYCAAILMNKDDPSPGPVLNMIPAIAKFHVIRGLKNPCDDQALREFVEAVRRRYRKPAVQREPLTPCIVRDLLKHHLSAGLNQRLAVGLGDRLGYLLPLQDLVTVHGERGGQEEGLGFQRRQPDSLDQQEQG